MEIRDYRRFTGPYDVGGGRWLVYGIRVDSRKRDFFYFRDKEEAEIAKKAWNAEVGSAPVVSVEKGIELYEKHFQQLVDLRQRKLSTLKEAVRRLEAFFTQPELLLSRLTEKHCRAYLEKLLASPLSVDTKLNHVSTAKTFTGWCVGKGMLRVDPMEPIKLDFTRAKRKVQLRVDEAHIWLAKALEQAEAAMVAPRDESDNARWHREMILGSTVAAMAALGMGLRVSEIVTRTVRDVDQDGTVLWVDEEDQAGFDPKTDDSVRRVPIPRFLRPFLDRLTVGKERSAFVFAGRYGRGHMNRNAVLFAVRRVCDDAAVKRVTTHGMRGLFATLAVDDGATVVEAVAAVLGHSSPSTTAQHYAAVGSLDRARARQARKRLGLE